MDVPDCDLAADVCSACKGSGKRTIAELVIRFLYVAGLPLLFAVNVALLFAVPESWTLKNYLYGLAVLLGLLFLFLIEELAIPFILRLGGLAFGLFSESGRVCSECKGSGRREIVRPLPVKRWVKVLLLGSVILVVAVLTLCFLVGKGYIPF